MRPVLTAGEQAKKFAEGEIPVKVRFSFASPNSNNPNFVIIGDAFGFSVYFDYDRYERR